MLLERVAHSQDKENCVNTTVKVLNVIQLLEYKYSVQTTSTSSMHDGISCGRSSLNYR